MPTVMLRSLSRPRCSGQRTMTVRRQQTWSSLLLRRDSWTIGKAPSMLQLALSRSRSRTSPLARTPTIRDALRSLHSVNGHNVLFPEQQLSGTQRWPAMLRSLTGIRRAGAPLRWSLLAILCREPRLPCRLWAWLQLELFLGHSIVLLEDRTPMAL